MSNLNVPGNRVNFSFQGKPAYAPPLGDAVNFQFTAGVPDWSASAAFTASFTGQAVAASAFSASASVTASFSASSFYTAAGIGAVRIHLAAPSVAFNLTYQLPAIRVNWPALSMRMDRNAFSAKRWTLHWPKPTVRMDKTAFAHLEMRSPFRLHWPPLTVRTPRTWRVQWKPLAVRFNLGAVASTTVTYCYNLRSEGGPQCTVWPGFDFIAILPIRGKNYLVKSTGIYLMGGETDNCAEINSSFTLSPMAGAQDEAGNTCVSRCQWAHVGLNERAHVYTRTDVNGTEDYKENGPYPVNKGQGNQRRAQFGKGLRSGLWGFRIDNVDGERLKVHSLSFDFMGTSRRI
jgi:hypothetical protein